MEDLLARWQGAAWRAEVDGWVEDVMAGHGVSLAGPGVEVKTRFWSAVRRYGTTAGTVWAKECNPGQAFEGPLLVELAALEPTCFPAPVAVDAARGRLLLPHAGTVRARGDRDVLEQDLHEVLVHHAGLQQRLAPHRDRLVGAGLPSLTPDELPAWVEEVAADLAARPTSDPQHLDRDGVRRVLSGLPRVRRWCEALGGATGGARVPHTFQHDDLNPWNVARTPAGPVCFDVGDAFWSHPFAVLQVPLAVATGTWPWGPEETDPVVVRGLDAYLAAWTGDGTELQDLRPLVGPALRLAQAHRGESWRRLLAHVPPDRLGWSTPVVRDYLLRVVG